MRAMSLPCREAKLTSLKLKTRHEQLVGYQPLYMAHPTLTFVVVSKVDCSLWTENKNFKRKRAILVRTARSDQLINAKY